MNKEGNKTIKEWQIELGIIIKNAKGFKEQRNKLYNNKYSKKEFLKCAKLSEIICKTEKGLAFLEG